MYPRTVTEKIVELWALGFSAEETRQVLREKHGINACLNTIYKHRHSLTAQNLIDELIRRQERAIFKADSDNPALAMKYRDKLLEKLIPQRIEALSISRQDVTVTQKVDLSQYSEEDKIAILDAYRRINQQRSMPTRSESIH